MIEQGVVRDAMQRLETLFRSYRPQLLEAFGSAHYRLKEDGSIVTDLDVRIEKEARDLILNTYQSIGFLGEETGQTGNASTYWCIDPIDGTSSFIRGLPFSTNMAALVHENRVVASLIYDFVRDELFTAIENEPAHKNGQRLHIDDALKQHDEIVYVLGGEYFSHVREAMHELGVRAFLPLSASGHAYTLLAQGMIDGVVQINQVSSLYDRAPGVHIAEQSGAVMYCLDDAEGADRSRYIIGRKALIDRIEASGLF